MQALERALGRLATVISWVGTVLAVTVLAAVVAILVYEIVARFGFNRPTGWSDEMVAYLMPAIVFLGAGYTLLRGGHIRIDSVYVLLPASMRRWCRVVNESVGLAALVLVTWYAGFMVQRVHRSELVASAGTLTFPEYVFRLVVPVGLAIMALAQLVLWLRALLALAHPQAYPDDEGDQADAKPGTPATDTARARGRTP